MSSLDSQPATMEELHQFVRQQALNHAQNPSIPDGFIGPIPHPPASTFIGQRRIKAGPQDEPIVRVVFRCQPPPLYASRHVVLHMKPSVTEEVLAMKLCEIFDVPQNGGVITRLMPKVMPGRTLFPETNKMYSWAHVYEWLGSTKGGFVEVTVVPVEAMGVCVHCGSRKATTPEMIQEIRQWCIGVKSFCTRCLKAGAMPDNTIELCMPDGRVFQRHRF